MHSLSGKRHFLVLAMLVMFVTDSFAQIKRGLNRWQPNMEKSWWIQYNPMTLMEPEIAIVATGLYKPTGNIGLALDAGFFVAQQNYSDEVLSYKGFRLKPEFKFYPNGAENGPYGLYFSLQGLLKNTTADKEQWFTRQNSNGQVIFNQLANYKEKKFVYGLSIIFGGEILMGAKKRFMLDIYTGPGIRNKRFKAVGLPDGITIDYNLRNDRSLINIYKNGSYLTLAMGFKLGIRID
jgi:hypothetical protein